MPGRDRLLPVSRVDDGYSYTYTHGWRVHLATYRTHRGAATHVRRFGLSVDEYSVCNTSFVYSAVRHTHMAVAEHIIATTTAAISRD